MCLNFIRSVCHLIVSLPHNLIVTLCLHVQTDSDGILEDIDSKDEPMALNGNLTHARELTASSSATGFSSKTSLVTADSSPANANNDEKAQERPRLVSDLGTSMIILSERNKQGHTSFQVVPEARLEEVSPESVMVNSENFKQLSYEVYKYGHPVVVSCGSLICACLSVAWVV